MNEVNVERVKARVLESTGGWENVGTRSAVDSDEEAKNRLWLHSGRSGLWENWVRGCNMGQVHILILVCQPKDS